MEVSAIYIYIRVGGLGINTFIGANVAKYSSQNLSRIVIESDDFKKGEYTDALRKGFLKIDQDLRAGI